MLLKLSSLGAVEWARRIEGSGDNAGEESYEMQDGGYLLVGSYAWHYS